MNTVLITYDLNKPGQDYTTLIQYIKGLGSWCHALASTWLVRTYKSASTVRDEVGAHVDSGDDVLVMNVTGDDWASWGLSNEINEWLKQYV